MSIHSAIIDEGRTRGSDSIPAPREGDRARNECWQPVPITDLGPSVPPPWVCPGYIARGHSTLLTALWKSGKTTLVAHLIRDLVRGGGLAGPKPPGIKALVVSEESPSHWMRRRDDLGLGPNVHILCRPFKRRPEWATWHRFIDTVSGWVRADGYGLVVFDTLPALWPVNDENDAPQVLAAVTPMHTITEAGTALLLTHHPRKGDAAEGQASRGSGALPGAVDVILELRRYAPEDARDRRRVLRAYSRFDETPPEAVLELTDAGYAIVGDKAEVRQSDRLGIIGGIVASDAAALTADEVLERWPSEPKPGGRTVLSDLNAGAEGGRWARTGTGRKGDPYRFVSRTPSPLGCANGKGPGQAHRSAWDAIDRDAGALP